MALSLSRWRPRHLLAAWGTYWAALTLVMLGGPALIARRVASGPEGSGTITAGFDNARLHLTMLEQGTTVWSGSTSVLAATLWIAGPPLLLWLAWFAQRPRPTPSLAPTDTYAAIRAADPLGAEQLTAERRTRDGARRKRGE